MNKEQHEATLEALHKQRDNIKTREQAIEYLKSIFVDENYSAWQWLQDLNKVNEVNK